MTREQIVELRERLAEQRIETLANIEAREQQVIEEEARELARRQRAARVVQKEAPPAVVYKRQDDALQHPPAPPASAFTGPQVDELAANFDNSESEARAYVDAGNAALRTEICELRGQVQALLAVLGNNNTRAARVAREKTKLLAGPK
jgi:hypothetical protein